MSRYGDTLRDTQKRPIAGAKVYVYNAADESLAVLTEDGGGALANPVTSDEYGNFYFNAPDGIYILEFIFGGKKIFRQEGVVVGAPVIGGGGGTGITDGDKGDIVVVGNGTSWTLDPNLITTLRGRGFHTGTQLAATISDLTEAIQDTLAATLQPGANIAINYDDAVGKVTITGLGGGGGSGGTAWFVPAVGTGAAQVITLPEAVDPLSLLVFADGLQQDPTEHYTVSGTSLTTTQAVGADISVIHVGGAPGAAGPAGRTILNGTGAPANSLGSDGDYYIANDTKTMYGPKASGAWPAGFAIVGPAGSVVDGDKGDITVSGGGTVWGIDLNAVTLGKRQQVSTATFLGRSTAGTGNVEALTADQVGLLLPTFTTGVRGQVPAPGTVTGKVLSDNGTWVTQSSGGGGGGGFTPVAQTSSFTIASTDTGKLYDATGMAAAITATLPAASTVSADFAIKITNRSYNQSTIRYVTLTRNGTDTIDGDASNLNVYAETVTVRRNAAGNGWIVEKGEEVLCWDFANSTPVAAVDFTAPFNDAQFEGYRIAFNIALSSQSSLILKLFLSGVLIETGVYSTAATLNNGTISAQTNATYGQHSVANGLDCYGIIDIKNARASGGTSPSNSVQLLSRGGSGTPHFTDAVGAVISPGVLTGIRFAHIGGASFNVTPTRIRIFGIRRGS